MKPTLIASLTSGVAALVLAFVPSGDLSPEQSLEVAGRLYLDGETVQVDRNRSSLYAALGFGAVSLGLLAFECMRTDEPVALQAATSGMYAPTAQPTMSQQAPPQGAIHEGGGGGSSCTSSKRLRPAQAQAVGHAAIRVSSALGPFGGDAAAIDWQAEVGEDDAGQNVGAVANAFFRCACGGVVAG